MNGLCSIEMLGDRSMEFLKVGINGIGRFQSHKTS